MSILHLEWAKDLRRSGDALGRDGMSKRALEIMAEYSAKGSYKAAMVAAGRLKALATAAKCDDYWTEQVNDGFQKEMRELRRIASSSPISDDRPSE